MSTPIDDGGPAFPQRSAGNMEQLTGMSLRDWFAGQSFPACYAAQCPPAWRQGTQEHIEQCASESYAIADAMLAARKDAT